MLRMTVPMTGGAPGTVGPGGRIEGAGEDAPPAGTALREACGRRRRRWSSDRLKQVNLTDQDAVMMKTNRTLAYTARRWSLRWWLRGKRRAC